MNANQKIAEIIRENELLDSSDLVTLKQLFEELDCVAPRNGNYCIHCGRTSSHETIFNCDINDFDKAHALAVIRKLRDMVEGVPDKPTHNPWATHANGGYGSGA